MAKTWLIFLSWLEEVAGWGLAGSQSSQKNFVSTVNSAVF